MFPYFIPRLRGLYPFVTACKGCHEDIAAPVATLPDDWIIATCPLCGQKRRYLPAEIFREGYPIRLWGSSGSEV